MKHLLLLFLLLTFGYSAVAQGIPISYWRTHTSFGDGIYTQEVGNNIFVATRNGFYSVEKADFGIKTFSKSDGFSDVFAHTFEYSPQHNALFIAYRGGIFDMLQHNRITSVRDLFVKNIEVNDFYVNGNICYVSHSQGVSEYNIIRKEFRDSYDNIWGAECKQAGVRSATVLNNEIYLASEHGIIMAPVNGRILRDCANWQSISSESCLRVVTFKNMIWAAFADRTLRYYDGSSWITKHNAGDNIFSLEVNHGKLVMARHNNIIVIDDNLNIQTILSNQQNHAVLDNSGYLWLAKSAYSSIRLNPVNNEQVYIIPNGPATADAYKLINHNNTIWVATGGPNETGGALFKNSGFFSYTNDVWTNYNSNTVASWMVLKDVMDIKTHPRTGNQWVGSLDSGLIEFDAKNMLVLKHYNATNSSLRNADVTKTNPPVSGLAFDSKSNLWVSNYRAQRQLSVLTRDGNWFSFNIGPRKSITNVLVDKYNQIWLTLPREGGIYVFNYGKTIEDPNDGDQIKDLSSASGNGALPDNVVICMAEDKEGQIWVGGNNGVAVFSEPSLIFSQYNFDAHKIWVENGDESGYLLAGQVVTCMAVDGGNRKWFGTRNGVYLTSPDGSTILKYFTTRNSPLISNDIRAIEVNGANGEVFFATDKGIVSYRSTATEGGEKHGDVYAFPNPVKPGYNGPIAINGLVRDASVKITDITGKLVFETQAEGGQAIWNGKNFNGEDANSGVYMVFSTNKEGTETAVTKILIVR